MTRAIQYLSDLIDALPRSVKAVVAVVLIINGIKAIWALALLLIWGALYFAVRTL